MRNFRILPLMATVFLAGAFLFAGCEKEKKTESVSITEIPISSYCIYGNIPCAELKIIHSQEEFVSLLGDCADMNMAIDFSQYDLFVLWGQTTYNFMGKDIVFQKYKKEYHLEVTVREGDGPSVEKWAVSFIAPKTNSNVSLKINKIS